MSSLEQVWGHQRLAAIVYDGIVQSRVFGPIAASALWGFEIRKLFASIGRVRETAPGARVLDVPCGGGLVLDALSKDHGLVYVALDFSPVMLSRARQRAARLGLATIRFERGDVGSLPFGDGSFDLCLTYNGLHCFPDPARALRELGRVSASGGRLRGTTVVRGAGGRFDPLFRLYRNRGYFGPGGTRNDLVAWLEQAGFRVEALEQSGAIVLFEATRCDGEQGGADASPAPRAVQ